MRTIARVFMVLFCLTFLANQARSLSVEGAILGQVIGKLMLFTSSGLAALSEALKVHNERLQGIENHLAKTSDFSRSSYQVKQENRRILEKDKEFRAAGADLLDFLNRLDDL